MAIIKKFLNKLNSRVDCSPAILAPKEKNHREVSVDKVYSYLESNKYTPLYVMNGTLFICKMEYIGNDKVRFTNYAKENPVSKEPAEDIFEIKELKGAKMLDPSDRILTFLGIKEVLDGLEANGL